MCLIFYGLKEISTYVAPSLADALTVAPNTSETNLMGTMTRLLIHLLHNIPQMIAEIFQSKERNEQEDHHHINRHNHSFKGHFHTPFLIRIINHGHEGQQTSLTFSFIFKTPVTRKSLIVSDLPFYM